MTSESNKIPVKEHLIVALDVPSDDEALDLVDKIGDEAVFYKVGLELFCKGSGIGLMHKLIDRGCKVFADFKLYDVPTTVQRATRQLNGVGIDFLTVHGDVPIMLAAVEAAKDFKVLAVTILTSMTQESIRALGFSGELKELVLLRAADAHQCGCGGVIASGQEATALKSVHGNELLVITPGVRNEGNPTHDQRRTVSIREAFAFGVDHVVVGRPIRDATDPAQAARNIQSQIKQALNLDR